MKPPTEPWEPLVRAVYGLFDDVRTRLGIDADFAFGGGTMLSRRYRHRLSRDVDVFLTDAQVVGALSPRVNDYAASRFPDYQESVNVLRFKLGSQEIDIIAAGTLTDRPTRIERLCGRRARIEVPREILAKKLVYRARQFTPRDVFDLAVVAATEPQQLRGLSAVLRGEPLRSLVARFGELAGRYATEAPRAIDALPSGRKFLRSGIDLFASCLADWHRELLLPVPGTIRTRKS